MRIRSLRRWLAVAGADVDGARSPGERAAAERVVQALQDEIVSIYASAFAPAAWAAGAVEGARDFEALTGTRRERRARRWLIRSWRIRRRLEGWAEAMGEAIDGTG